MQPSKVQEVLRVYGGLRKISFFLYDWSAQTRSRARSTSCFHDTGMGYLVPCTRARTNARLAR